MYVSGFCCSIIQGLLVVVGVCSCKTVSACVLVF